MRGPPILHPCRGISYFVRVCCVLAFLSWEPRPHAHCGLRCRLENHAPNSASYQEVSAAAAARLLVALLPHLWWHAQPQLLQTSSEGFLVVSFPDAQTAEPSLPPPTATMRLRPQKQRA
mmetsp:Transcript_86117/g.223827  ORF Transcript_86117/g.223827 Transcript_86117/m.223827 type:complete len:119 (+) Transcript_86117:161-517(+)